MIIPGANFFPPSFAQHQEDPEDSFTDANNDPILAEAAPEEVRCIADANNDPIPAEAAPEEVRRIAEQATGEPSHAGKSKPDHHAA